MADPTAPEISALVADMIETMADAEGIGLAAPQVFVPQRLVIIRIPPERVEVERAEDEQAEDGRAEDGQAEDGAAMATALTVMVNPVIEPLSEETDLGWEACLSVPGMAGEVPRYRHIGYRYQTLSGETVTAEAHGFPARVIQHECDHLDGILYPMRIEDMANFGFVEEVQRNRRDTMEAQDS